MTHPDLQEKYKQQFMSDGSTDQMYTQHLQKMQQSEEWGTESEIIAAAHLFQYSIFCFSRYNRTKVCLQMFSPHFLDSQICSPLCCHHSLYLVNTSGAHYELASVTVQPAIEK